MRAGMLAGAAVVAFVGSAAAQTTCQEPYCCPGWACFRGTGNAVRSECVLTWKDIRDVRTTCEDGAVCDRDGAANGSCQFAVVPCLDTPSCSIEPYARVERVSFAAGDHPAAAAVVTAIQQLAATGAGVPRCAPAVLLDVPASVARRGASTLRLSARAGTLRDRDRLTFRCLPAGTVPRFSSDVAPILAARCAPTCHEPEGRAYFRDLSPGAAYDALTGTRGMVRPGRPARSRLVSVMRHGMPPGCFRTVLGPEWAPGGCPTREEIELVSDWIAVGAPAN